MPMGPELEQHPEVMSEERYSNSGKNKSKTLTGVSRRKKTKYTDLFLVVVILVTVEVAICRLKQTRFVTFRS